jgi:DNA gyrase subunit A
MIYITSVPYTANKSTLVERIADVALSRKLPPLLDVRDLSTDDVRIAIELKKDADEKMVMAYLFKHTPLQINFAVNLTCLIPTENPEVGRPERLDLHSMLWHFLHFRLDVVTKRLEHELASIKKRVHILEGFEKVFDALDEILKIVRKSEGKADAADIAIRTGRGTDRCDSRAEVSFARLGSSASRRAEDRRRRGARSTRCSRTKTAAGTSSGSGSRRSEEFKRFTTTSIASDEGAEHGRDFIVEEDNVVLVSRDEWVKRQKEVKDVAATRVREGDSVLAVLPGSTRSAVVFFSNFGVASSRVADIRRRPATASRFSGSSSSGTGASSAR